MPKPSHKPVEKRLGRRLYTRGVLEFYDEAGVFLTGSGRLVNLSTTGALVESAAPLTLGQVLRFRLRFEGTPPLELMARVARLLGRGERKGYGLKFGELSSSELRHIKSLL